MTLIVVAVVAGGLFLLAGWARHEAALAGAAGEVRSHGFDASSWERTLPHAYALGRVDDWERHFAALGGSPGALLKRVAWVEGWSGAQQKKAGQRRATRPSEPGLDPTIIPPEPGDFPD